MSDAPDSTPTISDHPLSGNGRVQLSSSPKFRHGTDGKQINDEDKSSIVNSIGGVDETGSTKKNWIKFDEDQATDVDNSQIQSVTGKSSPVSEVLLGFIHT